MTEPEKECFKCGEVKGLSGFYKHPQMPDGHVNKCKECNKKDVRENRAKKIDYYREYDRDRATSPHRVKAREEYAKTPAGLESANKAKKRWIEANKKKYWVSIVVGNAVRDGKLEKPSMCESCGKSKCRIEGHHDDYDRPMEVRWLCCACHRAWHKENGEGANAE